MNTRADDSGEWESCPAGRISTTVERNRARERHADRLRAAVWGASSVAVLVVGLFLSGVFHGGTPERHEFEYGGIVCSNVMQHARDFAAGRLDGALAARIRAHLAECPHCGPKVERMRDEMERQSSHQIRLAPRFAVASR